MEKQEQQRKRFMHTVNMDIVEGIKNEDEFNAQVVKSESKSSQAESSSRRNIQGSEKLRNESGM